jgi:hypothetical protein
MGQETKTMVIESPNQKRQVEVTFTVTGNWFNREYNVLSCPAISDWGGNCYRECKSQLECSLRLDEWNFRQWLS